ncbi:hypothetical protein TB2_047135 [Malus domestica]
MQQPNRNTTALQPLSSAVLRKKPKGPEDGEPSNQPSRNTTALQPLSPAVIRKKPKGPEDGEPSDVVRHAGPDHQQIQQMLVWEDGSDGQCEEVKEKNATPIAASHSHPTNSGENSLKPSENVEDIRRQESREFGKREMSPASRVSKEVFDISLSLLRDATEKKPSFCMFEQVEKKNPACPTMVPRLANSAKMDTPAAAMP